MKRLWLLVALVWVPFVSIFGFASPVVAKAIGDSYPHMAFHVFSILLLLAAAVMAWRLRRDAGTRLQRIVLAVLGVSVPLAVAGNVAELIAAVGRFAADGWQSKRTPDLFGPEGGLHALAANLTIPASMTSMLLTLVLLAATAFQARRLQPAR